ncbi:LacI family transcriptional regulator [Agromyces sp. SYSU K20354]|uniref:LacI family DNA-binding transcriptional regulator n=1 Tax=Agromyces cavernae TaxID=2898659 RepID=UPI001E2CE386|nr:LacI family DNA-binding transcriptional regulator [Agromyces cavernae]MCD2443380.1 LacI family transcriptional regulator [Agromyces cavernae]
MNDVAAHAGVSVMTVSNVVNRPEIVSAKTKAKVQASMRELRYRNNIMARSLRLARPTQIGYALPPRPRYGDGYMDEFLHALASASQEQNMNLTLIAETREEDWLSACESLYYGGSAAGIVLTGIEPDDERPAQLQSRGIPFAGYGQTKEGMAVSWSWVDTDGARGIELAVDHVVERGHHRLAFIGHDLEPHWSAARLEGFVSAARKHGLPQPIVADPIPLTPGADGSGEAITAALLRSESPPSAIICASDYLAVGAVLAIRALGLAPGSDVAVTGFDDTTMAAFDALGVTSVKQPTAQIARELARMVVDPPEEAVHLLLEPSLTVRSSTTG